MGQFQRRTAIKLLAAGSATLGGTHTLTMKNVGRVSAAVSDSTPNLVEQAKLQADDGDGNDNFGLSIALDSDTILIGAPGDEDVGDSGEEDSDLREAGSAYIFKKTDGDWTQQAKLVADDVEEGDEFGGGFSDGVALDGTTAFVGAPGAGAVYVFSFSNDNWTQQSKLVADEGGAVNEFGYSVAVQKDTAVIGERFGNVFVFTKSDGSWTQQTKLNPNSDSLALDGDTVLIGGATTYVFVRSEGSWTQQAEFDSSAGRFGDSVSLDEDTAVVGAPGDDDPNGQNSGSVFVFSRSDGSWTQQTKLVPDDGDEGDDFGKAVSVDDGLAVIGAYSDGPENTGSAYLFSRSDGDWTQEAKLLADDGDNLDEFGRTVDLEKTTATIGAPYDDDPLGYGMGSVYVFAEEQIEVTLNIKPCGDPNTIYPDRNGLIPVGIKHTDDFNPVERVDVSTLKFGAPASVRGGSGASPAHDGHVEDTVPCDGDGRDDLIIHFPTEDTGFEGNEDTGRLEGETNDGTPLFGTDSVNLVSE